MKKLRRIKPLYWVLGLAALGVVGGFVYYQFWGCTESCPLNSNPAIASLRGGLLGACAGLVLMPGRSKESENLQNDDDEKD